MRILATEYWALWVACILLLVSCLVSVGKVSMSVPNWLSLSSIVGGLLIPVALTSTNVLPSAGGGILSSLGAAIVGLLSLLPLYVTGRLGGGSVKMQMGFGAWVGGALPFQQAALRLGISGLVYLGIYLMLVMFFISSEETDLPDEDNAPQRRLVSAQPFLALASIGTTLGLSLTDRM